jgi:hypothetical protein
MPEDTELTDGALTVRAEDRSNRKPSVASAGTMRSYPVSLSHRPDHEYGLKLLPEGGSQGMLAISRGDAATGMGVVHSVLQ